MPTIESFSDCMRKDVPALQQLQADIRRRTKQGQTSARDLERLARRLAGSQERVKQRSASLPRIRYPDTLPIAQHIDLIRAAVREHPVVIVAGETGSGKTTQLPKLLIEEGYGTRGMVGCTQPRRIAATSVTSRVAEELEIQDASRVAYQVRFDNRTDANTLIKFMTDGILLTETQSDADLLAYDALIIDEVHERSLNIDFLLGYLKRILSRRPDLKLIISSATLEVERFSEFFHDAPIISVPGKTFPIELFYRAPGNADTDLAADVADALDELTEMAPEQNVLVFLTGEQDIRETARVLEGRRYPQTDILPLYARLPPGEQRRAFAQTPRRRVILATNVAETSLTIPGIHVVVDSGLARIKRYNHRTQVEKLHIEPISQASARQRMGRCGRVSAGVCIRLYAEDDFEERPAFTDPEIKRSSLASVILTMLNLRLGHIEDFPFLDPPSPAMIKDGYRELNELQALTADQTLTDIGRKLARFSIEPSLGRMLLEGDRQGVLKDVLTVVSGLSIDDPRLRPAERRDDADKAHAPFKTETSDFAGFLLLWAALEANGKSNSRLRPYCRDNYLSFRRVQEWRFVRKQLESECRQLGLRLEGQSANDEPLHRSLLAGLLGRIGLRHEDGGYRGARSVRFYVHPSSGLSQKRPEWVVAAELTETSRIFGRYVGVIHPEWVEALAQHLCTRRYGTPYWDADTGYVRAEEFTSLYGLPLSEGRRRHYGDIDPAASRRIFIQCGLIEGRLHEIPGFLQHNFDLIRRLESLEAKARKRDILVTDDAIFAFYESRLPHDICNLHDFLKWLFMEGESARMRMTFTQDALLLREPEELSSEDYPDAWVTANNSFPLRYQLHHGQEDDGITCTIPLQALPELNAQPFEWLVPGMLPEKIEIMLKGIPKRFRRMLVPMNRTIPKVLADIQPRSGPLKGVLDDWIFRNHGFRIPQDVWIPEMPLYLQMRFEIVDDGEVIDRGRDLAVMQLKLKRQSESTVTTQENKSVWTRAGLTEWDFDTLPGSVSIGDGQWSATRYPGLRDEGSQVSMELYTTAYAACQASRYGLTRLAMLAQPKHLKQLQTLPQFSREAREALLLLHQSNAPLHDHLIMRTVAEVCGFQPGTLPSTRAEFDARVQASLAGFYPTAKALHARTDRDLSHAARLLLLVAAMQHPWQEDTRRDITEQLNTLFHAEFLLQESEPFLRRYECYLKAIDVRLERLSHAAAKDAERMAQIAPWQARMESLEQGLYDAEALARYRIMLQEWRVSLFAQTLGTPDPISLKRIEKQWAVVSGT